jgi:hypothetical protein
VCPSPGEFDAYAGAHPNDRYAQEIDFAHVR